jgi:hypothetical protein
MAEIICIALLVFMIWASTRGLPQRDTHPTEGQHEEDYR